MLAYEIQSVMQLASKMIEDYSIINTNGLGDYSFNQIIRLEPIGIGKPLVESLASYVSRIAQSHTLSVKDMVKDYFQPELESIRRLEKTSGNSKLTIKEMCGVGKNAQEWVRVLDETIQLFPFRNMTMLPFAPFFSSTALIRPERMWCPCCYEDWKKAEATIYEPLLWSLHNVKCCGIHKVPLEYRCQKCSVSMNTASPIINPGHCDECGSWLGGNPSIKDETQYTGVEEALMKMMTLASDLDCRDNSKLVSELLDNLVEKRMKLDGVPAFSTLLKISPEAIRSWVTGDAPPTISQFLKICSQFNLELEDVLMQTVNFDVQSEKVGVTTIEVQSVNSVNWNAVHVMLKDMLANKAPLMRIIDIARYHKCHQDWIRGRFPELVDNLELRIKEKEETKNTVAQAELIDKIDEIAAHLIASNIFPTKLVVYQMVHSDGFWMHNMIKARYFEMKRKRPMV